MKAEQFIIEYKLTGEIPIYTEKVIKKWNPLFRILQWNNTFRLVKYIRKDSSVAAFKISIYEKDAREIINQLGLLPFDGGFKSATTWKYE